MSQRARAERPSNEIGKENLSGSTKKSLMNSQDHSEEYTPIFEEEDRFGAEGPATLDSKIKTVDVALPEREQRQSSPRHNSKQRDEEEKKMSFQNYYSPAKRSVPPTNHYSNFGSRQEGIVKRQAAHAKKFSGVDYSKTSKPGSAGKKDPMVRSPSLLATGSLDPTDEKYIAQMQKHLLGG